MTNTRIRRANIARRWDGGGNALDAGADQPHSPRFALVTAIKIDYNGRSTAGTIGQLGIPAGPHNISPKGIRRPREAPERNVHRVSCGYRVPYVEAPGNHDVTPADKRCLARIFSGTRFPRELTKTYFGQRSWSLRMGDFYVLMHDWIRSRLERLGGGGLSASLADPPSSTA